MTAPPTDAWQMIRDSFPDVHARYDDILAFIRANPGCGFCQVRASVGCDGAGLMRVLLGMHRDGTVTMCLFNDIRAAVSFCGGCPAMISTESTATSGPVGSA